MVLSDRTYHIGLRTFEVSKYHILLKKNPKTHMSIHFNVEFAEKTIFGVRKFETLLHDSQFDIQVTGIYNT